MYMGNDGVYVVWRRRCCYYCVHYCSCCGAGRGAAPRVLHTLPLPAPLLLRTNPLTLPASLRYGNTFEYARKPDCPCCGARQRTIELGRDATLRDLVEMLVSDEALGLRLKSPSLSCEDKTLYMQKPVALEKATRANLDKLVCALVAEGEAVTVTDPVFPGDVSLSLSLAFL